MNNFSGRVCNLCAPFSLADFAKLKIMRPAGTFLHFAHSGKKLYHNAWKSSLECFGPRALTEKEFKSSNVATGLAFKGGLTLN